MIYWALYWTILEKNSGLYPVSDMVATRCFKLAAVRSFWSLAFISLRMMLMLFSVIS